MHILIAAGAVLAAILFFAIRMNWAARELRDLNRDTAGLQRRVRHGAVALFGSRLSRVRDPQLAAAILMIQLVRTGSPVTAQEKAEILRQLAGPIGVADPQALVERAWSYTQPRAFFSTISADRVPLLRDRLDPAERGDLIGALRAVAGAYGEPSELQDGSIRRLAKFLEA